MKHLSNRFGAGLFVVMALMASLGAGARTLPSEDYDVVVVGAGAAGIAAAGESGRAGAKTLLLEQGFQVGGNMTSGGVDYPGLFYAYGQPVITGFGWETVSNAIATAGGKFPPVEKWRELRHSQIQHRISIPIWVATCEEMLRAAGVTIRYYSSPAALARVDGCWHMKVYSGGDDRLIRVKEIVDCTGAGTAAALAGAELMREDERSPGAFRFTMTGLPPRKAWNVSALQAAYKAALADGSLREGDTRDSIFGFTHFTGLLTNYIDTKGEGTDGRGYVNQEGRASMLRLYRFLKKQPGFEQIQIGACAAEVGVRETARVKGEYVVTIDDYVTGRCWNDSLCYVFYPVDLHTKEKGVDPKYLPIGVKPTIPLRALLAKGVDHVLMAGRCLSADRMAMSAIRVQAACMATGQAAGEVAAQAALTNRSPRAVPLDEIKSGLRARGCTVPGLRNVDVR